MESFFRFMLVVVFIVSVFNFMCMATSFLLLLMGVRSAAQKQVKMYTIRFMYSFTLLVTYYAGMKIWPIIWGN